MWSLNVTGDYLALADVDVRAEETGTGLPTPDKARSLILRCTSKQRRTHLAALRARVIAFLGPRNRPLTLSYQGTQRLLTLRAKFQPQAGDLDPQSDVLTLRFVATDPLWSTALEDDPVFVPLMPRTTIASVNYLIERGVDGQWRSLGSGPGGAVACCVYSSAGVLHVGGAFGVKYWSGSAWVSVGAVGMSVTTLSFAPDGTLYAGGDAGLKYWKNNAWTATGIGATVYALAFVITSTAIRLYVGGSFAGGLKRWNHSTLALDSGFTLTCDGHVFGLTTGLDNAVIACGTFTTVGAVAAARVAKIADATPIALGAGFTQTMYALSTLADGRVACGGDSGVHLWNGQAWRDLAYPDGSARSIASDPGGGLFVASPTAWHLSYWTGSFWPLADLQVRDAIFRSVAAAPDGRVAVGCSVASSGTVAALATVNNSGPAPAPLKLVLTGSGHMQRLVNLTTGKVLYLDYGLLAGETLTIDLAARTVTSAMRPGSQLHAIRPGSAFFDLQPGVNVIGLYLTAVSGATAELQYFPRFYSIDSADV